MARKLKVGGSGDDTEKGVTATGVRRLIETGKSGQIIRDTRLPGFMARMNADGSVSFLLEYRAGRGRSFPVRRVVIARVMPDGRGGIERGAMSIAEARARAADIKARAVDERAPMDERDPLEKRRKDAQKLADERAAPTVGELVQAYIREDVAPTRRPRTVELYTSYLKHIPDDVATLKARDLTRARVRALHRAIGSDPSGRRRVTANRVTVVLKAALNWAISEERLPKGFENPARGIVLFEERGRERFLNSDELQRLGAALALAETDGIPWSVTADPDRSGAKHLPREENRREVFDAYGVAAVRLLALTGLRLREVLGLRWADIDAERGIATLADTKTGRRHVALGAAALAVIVALPPVGAFVIASASAGTPGERPRHDLKRIWRAVTRHAGLPGIRLHDLRHTAASTGAAAGIGLTTVGALLGHKNVATTAKYSHFANDPLRRAADKVSAEIGAAMGLPGQTADVVRFGRRK
jgi:integrase